MKNNNYNHLNFNENSFIGSKKVIIKYYINKSKIYKYIKLYIFFKKLECFILISLPNFIYN